MKPTNLTIEVANQIEQYYLIETNSSRDVNLCFVHKKPLTTSRVNVCILARKQAKVNLNATVKIEPTAQGSDTRLNILAVTTDQAHIKAAPNLEINNFQVKAGHALTTVHIDDSQLFYLTSRGISLLKARKLAIDGIVKPYLDGVRL